MDETESSIKSLVHKFEVASAGLAIALSPIPFADEAVFVPMYGWMAARIASRRGLSLRRVPWKPITWSIVRGLAVRGGVNFGVGFVPGIATAANATTAAALTATLGEHFDHACRDPSGARPLGVRELIETLRLPADWQDRLRARIGLGPVRRTRIEIPGLIENPEMAERVERALGAIEGVTRVRANPKSGRALVEADRPLVELGDLQRIVADLVPPDASPPPSLRRLAGGVRRLARGAYDRASRLRMRAERRAGAGEEKPAVEPWHARAAAEVLRAQNTRLSSGLSSDEAKRRLEDAGPNVLPGPRRRTALDIVVGQTFTIPNGLLGAAVAFSLLTGDPLEAGAIGIVVLANIGVGTYTESKAEELLHAWGKLRVETATVLRDGNPRVVRARDIVRGDILVLRAGDAVAADARVVEAADLSADESTLTGESEEVEKGIDPSPEDAPVAERRGMVYTGTTIAGGRGRAVVVATGAETGLGASQRALALAERATAPLEEQLSALGRAMAAIAGGGAGVSILFGLARREPLSRVLQNAVTLGVAAIPEGLPAVGTTALALASRRMRQRGVLIRRLAAAETLGSVNVICADKTGTLTMNSMRVEEIYLAHRGRLFARWSEAGLAIDDADGRSVDLGELRELARIAALNADVRFEDGKIVHGSGTEKALVEFALATGYPAQARRRAAPTVAETRRSRESPVMTTRHEHPVLGPIELVKGAPEEVIAMCKSLSPEQAGRALEENDAMAERGLRVLGMACRRAGGARDGEPLQFVGLVGLRDPLRPGVREAVRVLDHAGIEIRMLTGDQERTAAAIARQLGIDPGNVFSRVTPADKLSVIQKLQSERKVVAMTGDGVNDAPALKAADVGIAMGERGTDLARAVADVALAHDDLPGIVHAVTEGRALYDNVRRAVRYLVATNISEVLAMLLGSVVGAAPLAPLHLLWINILTDVAPGLALAVEPPERGLMERAPRSRSEPVFGPRDYRKLATSALRIAGGTLAAYALGRVRRPGAVGYARTMSFAAIALAQLLHTEHYRSATPAPNRVLAPTLWVSLGVQGLALGAPGLRSLLAVEPLSPLDFALSMGFGIASANASPFTLFAMPERGVVVERHRPPGVERRTERESQGAGAGAPEHGRSPL